MTYVTASRELLLLTNRMHLKVGLHQRHIVESIIELIVYALDGLIYGLCASKYGFVCK